MTAGPTTERRRAATGGGKRVAAIQSSEYRVPLRFRLRRHARRFVPLAVWSLTVATVVVLYQRRNTAAGLIGLANELRYEVASDATGRIDRLEVALNQEVEKDQIIAVLEDSQILLDLDRAKQELKRLEAELGRESSLIELRAEQGANASDTEMRRFARDIEVAHIAHLRALAELEEDRVRLQGLNLRLERSEGLLKQEVAPISRIDKDRTARDALEKRIAEQGPIIADLKQRYEAAQQRYDKFLASHPRKQADGTLLLKPLEYAVKVQEVRLEQINLDITRLVLRAPSKGRVLRILRREGEVVTVGETIVQLVEERATEIVAYLPEERHRDVLSGAAVELVRRGDEHAVLAAVVRAIGPRVVRLPRRLIPIGAAPQWGVPVYIPLPNDVVARPGESFHVRFVKSE